MNIINSISGNSSKSPQETNEDDEDEKQQVTNHSISQRTKTPVEYSDSDDDYYKRSSTNAEADDDSFQRKRLFEYDLYNFLSRKLKNKNLTKVFKTIFAKKSNRGRENGKNSAKSKHVMFADSLGLDLELIHTIHLANQYNQNFKEDCLIEFRKVTLIKQTFYNSYGEFATKEELLSNESQNKFSNSNTLFNQKTIIPKFSLNPDHNYKKLINNGICLNSIEIYNLSSIRGIILTLTKPTSIRTHNREINEIEEEKISPFKPKNKSRLSNRFSKFLRLKGDASQKNDIDVIHSDSNDVKLDLVYVLWSTNMWKSWKYHAAIQRNCKISNSGRIIKTHEFFIQNLDKILEIDQTLQLIICHQVDMIVFKDMMDAKNDVCYNFKCGYKI